MLTFLTAKNHSKQTGFTYLTWEDLKQKIERPPALGDVNAKLAKDKSEVIAATDAPNKQKETVLEHDNFTLIRLDLDNTDLDLSDTKTLLRNLQIQSFIIHTTASHQQQDANTNGENRYRVYIQLAASLPYTKWATLETYLSYLFGADDCATRPAQVMYLPVRFDGDKYEYYIADGLPLTVDGSELYTKALEFEQEQRQTQEAASSKNLKKPNFKERLIGKQVSIIDLVNHAFDWDSLLPSYGYKRQGRAYLPPESTSKKAGAYILTSHTDGKERYYSHHKNDPCANGKSLDQFDFIAIREFGGDYHRALKELAKAYFPKQDKHNKKEWAINKANESAKTIFKEVRQ